MNAIVTLSTIVLNDAADPSDVLVLSRMTKYDRKLQRAGRVQAVAGGGFRAITGPATQQTWTITLRKADAATVAWIEDHVGAVVCIRDDVGRKLFGIYLEPTVTPVASPRTDDVALELTEVTWSEAV